MMVVELKPVTNGHVLAFLVVKADSEDRNHWKNKQAVLTDHMACWAALKMMKAGKK